MSPPFLPREPIGYWVRYPGPAASIVIAAYWAHMLAICVFLFLIPLSHMHLVMAFPNVFFHDLRPMATMEPLARGETARPSCSMTSMWSPLAPLTTPISLETSSTAGPALVCSLPRCVRRTPAARTSTRCRSSRRSPLRQRPRHDLVRRRDTRGGHHRSLRRRRHLGRTTATPVLKAPSTSTTCPLSAPAAT